MLGFRFRTAAVDIEFKQNSLVAGIIKGYIEIPFFDAILEVEVGLTNDGDFTVAFSSNDGLLELEKDGVISIEVSGIEIAKEDGDAYVKISGEVTPLLTDLDWPSLPIKWVNNFRRRPCACRWRLARTAGAKNA